MPNHLDTRRRGIAMLLVMVALVVGMILTAGFMATQSTANGITRNQKSIGQTRMIAECGVDSCVWLIKNNSAWRRTMNPGNWISNMPINGGTLTVNVTDAAGNSSFATDNTQAAIIQSTAACNGQTITVQAVIAPSGGGTPWANGMYLNAGPSLQDSATIDGYNSTLGLYPLTRLLTSIVGTGGTGANGMVLSGTASVYGTLIAAPGNLLNALLGGLLTTSPSTITTAPETRTLGTVVPPNIAGFTAAGAFSKNTTTVLQPAGGQTFDSFALVKPTSGGTTKMTANSSAVYLVKGNFSMDVQTAIAVSTGKSVTFYVQGNTDIQGTVTLNGTGQFTLYTAGSVNIHNAALINSQSTSGQALILGLPGTTSVLISGTSSVAAGIYAPKAVIGMSGSAVLYGSAVGQSVTMQNTSAIHLDDAIKSRVLHQITGGSTMGDYTVTWTRFNGGVTH